MNLNIGNIGVWGRGCPVDTSAEGRSTDRGGSRDLPNKWLTRQALCLRKQTRCLLRQYRR